MFPKDNPFRFLETTQTSYFTLSQGNVTRFNIKSHATQCLALSPHLQESFLYIQEINLEACKSIISNKNLFLDFITNLSYEDVKRAAKVGAKVSSLEVIDVKSYEGTSSIALVLTNQDKTMELELRLDTEKQKVIEMVFTGNARSYSEVQSITMIESSFALAS